jgi:hypothetical protein
VRVFVVLVQFGVLGGNSTENLFGHGCQFSGLTVHEGQFPFHTKS